MIYNFYSINVLLQHVKDVPTNKYTNEDALLLFDSLMKNYPIGSIVLYHEPLNDYKIIDGNKRCSILKDCFCNDEKPYDIYFDVRLNKFVITERPDNFQMHISCFFSTQKIRTFFKKNIDANEDRYEEYFDNVDRCSSVFLDYRTPCIIIGNENIDIDEIKKRLNTQH